MKEMQCYAGRTPSIRRLEIVEETPKTAEKPVENCGEIVLPVQQKEKCNGFTPVRFKKLVCAAHLELDSDHSSGMEWSSAMATPSSRVTVQESPRSVSTTPTNDEDEDVEWEEGQGEYFTTDESIRELRRALHMGGGPENTLSKSVRGFSSTDVKANGKLVVRRTLFPKKNTLPSICGSGGVRGVAISSIGAASAVTTNVSPLVTSNWRSPARNASTEGVSGREEKRRGGGDCLQSPVSGSQELFGTPVFRDASSQTDASPQLGEVSQLHMATSMESRDEDIPPGAAERFAGCIQQQLPLAALHSDPPLVHSTPVHSTAACNRPKSGNICSGSTSLNQDGDPLENPFIHRPHLDAVSSPTVPIISNSVYRDCCFGKGQTDKGNKEKRKTNFSAREEDVLDVLFMSNSQLEAHFSLQHRESVVEGERPYPTEEQPITEVEETLWNFEEDVPDQPGKKDHAVADSTTKPSRLKRQKADHFRYPRRKSLNMRKSRIRAREVVQKPPKSAATIVTSGSRVVGERVGVGGGSVAAEVGLASPPVKKRLASADNEKRTAKLEEDRLIQMVGAAAVSDGGETDCNMNDVAHEEIDACVDSVSDIKGCDSKGKSYASLPGCMEAGADLADRVPQQNSVEMIETVHRDAALSTKWSETKASEENCSKDSCGKVNDQFSIADIVSVMSGLGSGNTVSKSPQRNVVSSSTDDGAQNSPPSLHSPGKGFTGFKTAGGGSIAISASALARAHELVDAELGDPSSCGPSMQEQEKGDKSRETNSDRRDGEPQLCGSDDGGTARQSNGKRSNLSVVKSGPLSKRKRRGFNAPRMARSVPKDEERASLARILKGFGITSSSSLQQQRERSKVCLPLPDADRTSGNVKDLSGLGGNTKMALQDGAIAAMGFLTAGGRSISVSRKSLQLAQEIISQELQDASDCVGGTKSSFGATTGFQTASGKGVTVSVQAISEDRKMQVNKEKKGELYEGRCDFPVGKEVTGLKQVEMAAQSETGDALSFMATGFKTAGGKGISVYASSLSKANEIVAKVGEIAAGDGGPQEHNAGGTCSGFMTGFNTASGKKLSVGSESMAKVTEAFQQELMDATTANIMLDGGVHMQAGTRVAAKDGIENSGKTSEASIARGSRFSHGNLAEKDIFFTSGYLKHSAHALTGFQTASGRGIQVKKSLLQKAQIAAATMESHEEGTTSRRCSIYEDEKSPEPKASSSCEGQSVDCDASGCSEQPCSRASVVKGQGGSENHNHDSNGFDGCADNGEVDHSYLSTQLVQRFIDLSSEDEGLEEGGRSQALLSGDHTNRPSVVGEAEDLQIQHGKTRDCTSVEYEAVSCPEELENKLKCCELSTVCMENEEEHMDILSVSRMLEDSGSLSLLPPPSQPLPPQLQPQPKDLISVVDPVGKKANTPPSCGGFEGPANDPPGVDGGDVSPVRNASVQAGSASSSPGQQSLHSDDIAASGLEARALLMESPLRETVDSKGSVNLLPHLSSASSDHLKDADTVKGQTSGAKPSVSGLEDVPRNMSWGGLQTASGRPVSVSEDSILVARAQLGGEEIGVDLMKGIQLSHLEMSEDPDKACNCGEGSGLVGARGKSEKTKASFRDSQVAGGEYVRGLEGKSETSAKAPEDKGSSTEAAPLAAIGLDLFQPAMEFRESEEKNSLAFRGFSTAAGRRVEVSEESLASARKTLAGDADGSSPDVSSSDTKRSNFLKLSTTQSSKAEVHLAGSGMSFKGFHTAGGRTVEVTENSLLVAKTLLAGNGDLQHVGEDMESGVGERTCSESASRNLVHFSGLQTASGKKVDVQKHSLAAAKALLGTSKEVAGDIHNRSGSPGGLGKSSCCESQSHLQLPGLQTASGKQVEISRQSLRSAKITLGDSGGTFSNQENVQPQKSARNTREHRFGGTLEKPAECSRLSDSKSVSPSAEKLEYLAKGWMGSDILHKSTSSRLREMQAKVQRTKASLTSIPEATLCDRNPLGKRLFPLQSSMPPGSTHSGWTPSPTATPNHSSRLRSSRVPCRELNIYHHNANKSSALSSSRNIKRTTSSPATPLSPPFLSPLRPSFKSPNLPFSSSSSSVSHPQAASVEQHSYYHATTGGCDFTTPVKGSSMKKSFCPAAWSKGTPFGHQQGRQQRNSSHPVWLSSTPKASSSSSTSSRLGAGESKTGGGASLDVSASMFQLTLSQIQELEASQRMLDFSGGGGSALGKESFSGTGSKASNDSGYVSREVSALKTPSPITSSINDTPLAVVLEDRTLAKRNFAGCNMLTETSDEDLTDIIFAEVAKEDLNDTLEHNSLGSAFLSPIDSTTSDSIPASQDTPAPPFNSNSKTSSANSLSLPPVESSLSVAVAASVSHDNLSDHYPSVSRPPAESCSSSIKKPRCGFLLDLRLQHAGRRIPLRDAVSGQLPGSALSDSARPVALNEAVLEVTSEMANNFRFSDSYFSCHAVHGGGSSSLCVGDGASLGLHQGSAGVEEFWTAFRSSPGVDEALISQEWFANHFSHLVVKLAAMERSFPYQFSHRCLTPNCLALQLKYRYDREVDRAQRSAIHRMCEHDDISSRRIVLYVSRVHRRSAQNPATGNGGSLLQSAVMGGREGSNANPEETWVGLNPETYELPSVDLSDGWYDLLCVLDRPLKHMLKTGRLQVGTKLMIHGAELCGLSSPCHPLKAPLSCHLKISANSTRRARWDAKLGYQRNPVPFLVSLTSLYPDGGSVGCVEAVVARIYPVVFLEKREGARNVLRCSRIEEREKARHERERERAVEEVTYRVRLEYENEVTQRDFPASKKRRSRRLNTLQVKQLMDGQEIYNALVNAQDPQAIQDLLSAEQLVYFDSYKLSLEAERQTELQRRIKEAMKEAEDEIPGQREVVPLLRLRLVPVSSNKNGVGKEKEDFDCLLSVWRPQEQLQEVKEGTVMKFSGLTATPSKYHSSRLQLTASRSTFYQVLEGKGKGSARASSTAAAADRGCYWPRVVTRLGALCAGRLPYREFDTVGMVVHVSTAPCPPRASGDVSDGVLEIFYLADMTGVLEVKTFGGLKTYGLEELLSVGAVVALGNLSYRGKRSSREGADSCPWPTAQLSDVTVVTGNPRGPPLKETLEQFKKHLHGDLDAFLKKVQSEIKTYL